MYRSRMAVKPNELKQIETDNLLSEPSYSIICACD